MSRPHTVPIACCGALLFLGLVATAQAIPAERGASPCAQVWAPMECGPEPSRLDPELDRHTLDARDPNLSLAYGEARDRAEEICSDYELLAVRLEEVGTDWATTIVIECP